MPKYLVLLFSSNNVEYSIVEAGDRNTVYEIFEEDNPGGFKKIIPIRIIGLKPHYTHVTKVCTECEKELFRGSEKEARGRIIYCTECAKKMMKEIPE
jgi:uncharacterized protein with PIN domain